MCLSTGNRYLDIGIGVALGAATGGAGLSSLATNTGFAALGGGASIGTAATTALIPTISTAAVSALGGAIIGGVGSAITSSMFAQPEFPTYDVPQQTAQVQQFNSQQIDTTGSGGRQATASLAEAIKRSKQRKLSQEDVGDLSIDTSAFASTGLQLA
jgi:hypothetical protein